jgi:hypothetical protein
MTFRDNLRRRCARLWKRYSHEAELGRRTICGLNYPGDFIRATVKTVQPVKSVNDAFGTDPVGTTRSLHRMFLVFSDSFGRVVVIPLS